MHINTKTTKEGQSKSYRFDGKSLWLPGLNHGVSKSASVRKS